MAYIRQIQESEATGLLKGVYTAGRARAGEVAKIIQVMGLDPCAAKASMRFYVALMRSANALDASRREMLAAVVSNVNDCYY